MNSKLFSLALIVFAFVGAAAAQSPNKILSRAAKALGGEKNLKAVTARQMIGKITRGGDGASGNYQAQAQLPNYFAEKFDLNGYEKSVGYNGKSAWTRDSKDGLRTLTGDAARDFQAAAAYRNSLWLNAKTDKSKLASGGQSNVGGKPANVVILTTAKGARIKIHFDQASGLPVREEIPFGAAIKIYDYENYKTVDGVMEPFTIRESFDGDNYVINFDEIKHNQPIAKTVFDFPQVSSEPLPDIKSLLESVRDNSEKIRAKLDNYSFTAIVARREFDKDGNLITKDTETTAFSFYKGNRVSRRIAKNGVPLSADEQAKEDLDAEKQIADIEKKLDKKEVQIQKGKTPDEDDDKRITVADALRGSLLVNPRRERFRGRDVVVFDYEPNPNFKPQTRMETVFSLCNGAVWVDEKDKQVVRLEAFLTKKAGNFLVNLKRGASFTLEQERVNDEIWLPSAADINLSVKILFAGISINQTVKYGDYKKFSSEVKDATVDAPPKP